MGKVKYYECLNCKDYNTVRMESKLTDQGLEITVEKCAMCSQFHILDDNGKLIKYTQDSHSSTEPFCDNCKKGLINYPEINRRTCQCGAIGYNIPFDTLQEGDFFIGSYEECVKVFEIEGRKEDCSLNMSYIVLNGIYFSDSKLYSAFPKYAKRKTQLTPEEFLRRADNTFKTK